MAKPGFTVCITLINGHQHNDTPDLVLWRLSLCDVVDIVMTWLLRCPLTKGPGTVGSGASMHLHPQPSLVPLLLLRRRLPTSRGRTDMTDMTDRRSTKPKELHRAGPRGPRTTGRTKCRHSRRRRCSQDVGGRSGRVAVVPTVPTSCRCCLRRARHHFVRRWTCPQRPEALRRPDQLRWSRLGHERQLIRVRCQRHPVRRYLLLAPRYAGHGYRPGWLAWAPQQVAETLAFASSC
jgi:hypothetical protein